ncbi:MAG: hypothetical protein ACM3XQ_12815, partial [Nocardioidaceae bacterium]
YLLRPSSTADASGRLYASYDLLKSGTGFTDEMFDKVWGAVFDFCEGSPPRRAAKSAVGASRR